MDTIKGNIEIVTGTPPNDTSTGITVEAATPDLVPTIVGALYGLTGLSPGTPEGDQQVAVWTGQDNQFRPVRVVLWREPPFDETMIGQLIAQATQGDGGDV